MSDIHLQVVLDMRFLCNGQQLLAVHT